MNRKSKWLFLGGAFVLLVGVRAFLWWGYSKTPIPSSPFSDPIIYADLGKAFALGRPLGVEALFHPPLYPYVVGGLMKFFGTSLWPVLVFQNFMGILASLLLVAMFLDSEKTFRRAGLALFLLLQSGAWILYEWRLYPESLAVSIQTCLLVTIWWLWSKEKGELGRGGRYHGALILAGIFSSVLILLRPNFVLLIPFAAAGFGFGHVRRKLGWIAAAYLVLLPTLSLLPVMIRNHRLGGGYSLSVNSGITFFQGNNAQARGGYTVVPGVSPDILRQNDDMRRIAREAGAISIPEANRFWMEKGLSWWKENSGDGFRLALRKARLFISPGEFGGDMPFDFERQQVPQLRALSLVNFSFVFFFSLFALRGLVGRGFPIHYATGLLGITFVTCILFYMNNRYRVPAWPIFVVGAVFGMDRLWSEWRRRGGRARGENPRAFYGAMILLGICLLIPTLRLDLPPGQTIAGWHNWGVTSARGGLKAQAIEAYQKVLAIDPNHVPTLENISREYLDIGDTENAQRTLDFLLGRFPQSYVGHKILSDLCSIKGDQECAQEQSRLASRLRSGS